LHNDNFNAIIKSKTAVEKGGCLAMMRYGIKDIRDLNSGNLKVLSQFNHE